MKRWKLTLATVVFVLAVSGGLYLVLHKHKPLTPAKTQTPTSHPAQQSTVPLANTHPPTRAELLELTNKFREDNGLSSLPEDPRLDSSAQKKADDEVTYNYIDHVSPHDGKHGYEYAHEAAPDCAQVSENLTENIHVNDAQHAMDAWENSPPHRAAILNPNDIGIGFGISGDQVVAHFCLSK